MKTITLVPGSAEWLQSRSASKAAAVMGQDAHTSRNELLRMMATGIGKEFSDWQQKHLLDKGHASEVGAIRYAEELLDDALSPVCGATDDGYLTANFDGLTFCGKKGVEAKAWNEKLAAAVLAGEVPDTHWPQLEQHIIVGNLDFVLFVVGDGTPEKTVSIEYRAVPGRAERLLASWKQFDIDLANYQHQEVIPAAVAAPIKELPTLFIQARGEVTKTNMPEFKAQITEFLGTINMKPATDQEFADGKEVAKKLRELAVKIKERKADMLAQTATIGEVAVEIDHLAEVINANALELEKAVKREEDARKLAIVSEGRTAFADHIAMLNTRLGKPYMPTIPADFAEAIKGKRLITAMQDAVATLLANKKIEASAIADRIEINLNYLRETAKEYPFLFADAGQIVLKANDDFAALAKLRIAEHKAEEERKLEAERQRIRAEEEARAAAKLKAEQEEASRQQREAAAAQSVSDYIDKTKSGIDVLAGRGDTTATPTMATVLHAAAPAAVANAIAPIDSGATIPLGEINLRLSPLSINADGLAQLGFPYIKNGAAKEYREADMPAIYGALVRHIQTVAQQPMRKAA